MAPRVEKTDVFRKVWNFANRTYFASCINEKTLFFIMDERNGVFPYFYHRIIFYRADLFDCAVNFKFHLNIFTFLKHKHKSSIKGAIFELRSSHLFWDQPYKGVLEVKCQACGSQLFYFLWVFFRSLVTFFRPVFCRISHNKFAILKIQNLTKILEIGKF